jgi:lipoprotein-anchoring transpeptidase ErfK/SrfK
MSRRSKTRLAACLLLALAAAPATAAPEMSRFSGAGFPAGDVVIRISERRLYLVGEDGTALSYPVALGKPGKQWVGTTEIDGKHVAPAWSPPEEVKRDNPRLPDVIAGGSPRNPMGAAALTLAGGEYAIHGTNRPETVGTYASYGCVRMHNRDVVDLYARVETGTRVHMVP